MKENLIAYYADIHSSGAYGNTSVKRYPYVVPYIKLLRPKNGIDYGCGQSTLHEIVNKLTNIQLVRYDPAIKELSILEQDSYDFLVNIDVLEHIPESELDAVISKIKTLSPNCLIIIDTRIAKTILANGENAHATIKPSEWWESKLADHFSFVKKINVKPLSRAAFVTFQITWYEQVYVNFLTTYYKFRRSILKRFGKKNA